MRLATGEQDTQERVRLVRAWAIKRTSGMAALAGIAVLLTTCASARANGTAGFNKAMRLSHSHAAQKLKAGPASLAHELGYSLTPSSSEPYLACKAPAPRHASCMSIVVPPRAVRRRSLKTPLAAQQPSIAAPNYEGSGELGGFSPSDLRSAYKIAATGGSGQTVAIVDAYNDPNAESDLKTYRSHYGLSECTAANGCFKKVNQKGEETSYPVSNSEWTEEISLDVDMVSAFCQECHILLVEAKSSELSDLSAAEDEAVSWEEASTKRKATEISNSWDGEEFSEETSYDTHFNHPGIPVTVSSGDKGGYGTLWPAASPYVIAVGGTELTKAEGSRGWAEKVWDGAGAGCSLYESKPSWQTDPGCAKRTYADIAAVASPESPVSIYDSWERPGWMLLGGTSVAAPLVAAIEAHSSTTVRNEGAEAAYRHALFDVTSGTDAEKCAGYLCNGEEGYDGPTGWGTPNGALEASLEFSAVSSRAREVTMHGATLNGYVYPAGKETSYWFEYGTTSKYGSRIPASNGSAGAGLAWRGVSQALTGLAFATTYHYRLVATSAAGTVYGNDHTFATAAWSTQQTPELEGGPRCGTRIFCQNLASVSCVSKTACMAVGVFEGGPIEGGAFEGGIPLSEHWNGTEWKVASVPLPKGTIADNLFGVSCTAPSACMAVGRIENESYVELTLAELWNGAEWQVSTTPNPAGSEQSYLEAVSCPSAGECMAAGRYRNSKNELRPLTERWNGSEWQMLETPFPAEAPPGLEGGELEGVSCPAANTCAAVGHSTTAEGGALAERWDGSKWQIQTLPTKPGASLLRGISCYSTTECTAVGARERFPFAEHWSEQTGWQIQSVPNPPNTVYGGLESVSCVSSSDCIAVGMPSDEFSEGEIFGEHWSGSEWTLLPMQVPDGIGDLWGVSCVSTGICVATGRSAGTPLVEREQLPSATTEPPSEVKRSEVTMKGVVNPAETDTHYYFEYGPTTAYGSRTAEVDVGSGGSNVAVKQVVTGLAEDTMYHFRLVATNAGGDSYGQDEVFQTYQWFFSSAFGSSGGGSGQFGEVYGVARDGEGHIWATDAANNRVEEFSAGGEYIREIKTEAYPYGVAIDSKGNVWVADSQADSVQEFSPTGTLILKFGSEGYENGKFIYPMGIAIDSKGNVWVADADKSRVEEFSSTGTFITAFGSMGVGNGQFEMPTGVAVNSEGDLWVVDSLNDRLEEFSSSGTFIRAVGSYGSGNGEFALPRGIAIDSEGHLLVTDLENDRVEELSSTGVYITQFGTKGSEPGQFHRPSSVATDSSGDVWVTDTLNNRVEKWVMEPSRQYVSAFGSSGGGSGQFGEVYGVARDGEGHIWATDAANNRVEEFSAGGEYIREIKTEAYPYGVAIDSKGNVWVADSQADSVQEFSPTGTLILKFGSEGYENGKFIYPMGIAIDSKGNVWVADADKSRVEEFSSTGTFITAFGSMGVGNGQFEMPTGVAVNSEGDLWVVDSLNDRLEEFSSSGTFIRAVGSYGSGNGEFALPRGIAIDSEGHLLVTDLENDRVEELSSTGVYITQFGTKGSEPGQFHRPSSVATDSSGDVWVTDTLNNRVEKWSGGGS